MLSQGYDIMKDDIVTSYGDLPDHKYFISVREFTTSAMEYIDSTRCSLLGEYKKLNVWIVKERIKCCVRSMAVELFNQHEEGYCLSRFGESNIWVAPTGHIRFRLVTRTKRTDELVCQNYLDLRNVIRQTVFRNYSMDQIPEDWRSLMSLCCTIHMSMVILSAIMHHWYQSKTGYFSISKLMSIWGLS